MSDFFNKAEYGQRDIEDLFKTDAEESIHLDFKAAGSLAMSDGKKNDISKDVASFANSDGGIIIYGINEKDHIAESPCFINGNDFSKEWLEQVINSRIQKRIPDIVITPIRFDNDITKSIYVVKIPQSNFAPHISSDKKYYKRFNFESVPMEEYEIRELFNRKQRTDISIADLIINEAGSASSAGRLSHVDYLLLYQICNTGNTIEEQCKIEIYIPRQLIHTGIRSRFDNNFNRSDENVSVYSIPNSSPIFPSELTTITDGFIQVRRSNLELLNDPGIRVRVYYTSGVKERIFNLLDRLTFNGTLIKDQFLNV